MIKKTRDISLVIAPLLLSQLLVAQNYEADFMIYFKAKNDSGQLYVLDKWEEEKPNDPALYTSYFNYCYMKSKTSGISLGTEPSGEESLQLTDSTGEVKGYLNEYNGFNKVYVDKGMAYINKGIKQFPNRLDMRFGKIYFIGELKDWELYTSEIIETVTYGNKIGNKWIWTNNTPKDKAFFLSSVQGYENKLYNTLDDSLLFNMRAIAEKVIEYYPNELEFLTNISTSYIVLGNYKKGIPYLLRALAIDPKDHIVLSNLAVAYKRVGDTTNAIKYFEQALEFGDERTKAVASKELEELKSK